MITFAILILIVAKALPGLNTHISSIHVTRITTIVFLFAGALTLNSLNIESISSGIGIYSGLFQVTTISQLIEIFLFMIGGGILIAWPQNKYNKSYPPSPLPRAGTSPWQRDVGNLPLAGDEAFALESSAGLRSKGGTDYSLVVLFSSLGSSLLISSYDLISVYLSIELQSFGLYVLSTLYRDSESSTSAGLKYFLLGGLSSCIILLGTGIIYSYTGTTNLESLYIINSVIDINQQYIIQGISLGLSLIFIGFLFKIAAAPLHNWSPDVYDGTPTIVTTWLTIIPKIAILFILLELQVKLGSFGPLGGGLKTILVNNSGYLLNLNQINEFISLIFTSPNLSTLGLPSPVGTLPLLEGVSLDPKGGDTNLGFNILENYPALDPALVGKARSFGEMSIVINNNILKTLLLISATLSLIIGSLLGLAQIRIKRLLAYSTISHIGFILLALAVNTEQSIDSFIFYIIQYTITNLNIFLVILGLTYCLSTPKVTYSVSFSPSFPSTLGSKGKEGGVATKEGGRESLPPLAGGLGNKEISLISEFKGLFFSNPLLSISLAVSLFSMAGIPPLIGFFSKQLVLYSALQNGYFFISVLAIIVSVISCSYYLQIIKLLFTPSFPDPLGKGVATLLRSNKGGGEGPTEGSATLYPSPPFPKDPSLASLRWTAAGGVVQNEINLTNTHSYLISTLTFTILLFFIKPSLILNSTQLLSLSLFYI
jgi:NADH:ubiquinone oxidoreductase subunit 2 (subunit N)